MGVSTRISYGAARATIGALHVLPLPVAAGLAGGVMRLAYRFLGRRRRVAVDNIRQSLGYDDDAAEYLARASFVHLGHLVVELSRLNDVPGLGDIVNPEAFAPLRDLMAEGRGLIIVSGHAGHWERAGVAAHAAGISRGAIARPLRNNPPLDAWLRRVREAGGQKIYDKSGALRSVLRVLRQGGGFAILADQDAGRHGMYVPFFGRPASTIATPATLAIRTGAPMCVAALHRDGRVGRFRLRVGGIRRADTEAADEVAETRRLTAQITHDLEGLIRQAPEQYLWLHRRWKHQPQADGETHQMETH